MKKPILLILFTALAAAAVTACSQKRVHEDPIIEQGDRVQSDEAVRGSAPEEARAERERLRERRDSLAAEALATCEPEVCEAVARGELALEMSEAQVLAATGTTESAWRIRRSGPAVVLSPVSATEPPSDAVASLAMVQLRDGRVTNYAYQESQGMRLVSSPEDATTEGRAEALADALLREGDDLAARGDLDRALDRYDRADVIRPGDPMTSYRIASALDKQLRPIEALIQYRLFLHQLELERIEARGVAAGRLADAIAQARQRVIILERETR